MAGSSSGMEVDAPSTTSSSTVTSFGTLKRSNSAPMINVLFSTTATTNSAPSTPQPSTSSLCRPIERIRRYSASSMSLHTLTTSLTPPIRMTSSRLDQIRQEESVAVVDKEVAHEREIQSAMQISSSWEELSLDDHMMNEHKLENKRPKSFHEPLHIFTSQYPYTSSPSPTCTGKQCFSPSLQQAVRNTALTPSPSPSPTRKSFVRRSLSPITLRPSALGAIKRKIEPETGNKSDLYFSPPKRLHLCPTGDTTPERKSTVIHPLVHSISSSSLEDEGSPEQNIFSLTNASTLAVPIVTSSHSPRYSFQPLRNTMDTQCTDSKTSNTTEASDMNEPGETVAMNESISTSPTASYTSVPSPHL